MLGRYWAFVPQEQILGWLSPTSGYLKPLLLVSLTYFIHQRLKFVNIFKAAVHAGKTHVGHFV